MRKTTIRLVARWYLKVWPMPTGNTLINMPLEVISTKMQLDDAKALDKFSVANRWGRWWSTMGTSKMTLEIPAFQMEPEKIGCLFLWWFICQMITIHPIVVSSTKVQYYSYYSESLPLMLLSEGCRGLGCSDCFTWTRRFALPPCYIYQSATVNW